MFGFILSAHSQRLDYLNKYWYPIADISKYSVAYYRITLEDSVRKSVRIISLDSVLVYQRIEMMAQKRQPMTQTEIWYNDSGKKTTVEVYSAKKNRKETTKYYDSGGKKFLLITENEKVVLESYFSEDGQAIEKPHLVTALPYGGITGWMDYLRQSLVYPHAARILEKEGLIYLHFYVTEEGKMEEIEVMNPEENHPSLCQEALRVASSYPYLWSPSVENGVVKKSEMRLPIRFKLTD